MVLGIRSKSRKNVSVQVEYLIHIEEIKPWPSSKKSSHQAIVFLQWDNGDQPSGSITSQISDGKIEFSESFRLPVTLIKEAPPKKKNSSSSAANNQENYQKNSLEFFLYEPRKDKPTKGQVLGQVAINLAEYYHGDAVSREAVSVAAPVSCKKSSKEKPVLFLSIQAFRSSSDGIDSVSEATGEGEEGEEEEEDYEIAAFTDEEIDDDVPSFPPRIRMSPVTQVEPETSKGRVERVFSEPNIASASRYEPGNRGTSPISKSLTLLRDSPPPSLTIGSSFNPRSQVHERAGNPFVLPQKSTPLLKKSVTHNARPSSHSPSRQENPPIKPIIGKRVVESGAETPESTRANPVSSAPSIVKYIHEDKSEGFTAFQVVEEEDGSRVSRPKKHGQEESKPFESLSPPPEINKSMGHQENGKKENPVKSRDYSFDVEECRLSPDAIIEEDSMHSSIDLVIPRDIVRNIKLKHAKSVQITSNASKSRLPEIPNRTESKKDMKGTSPKTSSSPDRKGELINSQIEKLKEELREAAAVEVGLYSVVAEHGSSANKIHAPARRLSRFYFHACKSGDKNSKANAAKAVISGFILVSKACGNDVPRLTFWLSNAIMLRAIVGQSIGKPRSSSGPTVENKSNGKSSVEKFDSLDEPQKFMDALENFESWIFSRIVESVWWQTMTPHMQPAAAKAPASKRASGRKSGFSDEDQGFMSIELWKKAFNDAHQRLCPSRASGHECGCLPVSARLVMEQLVSRLDVAMFNAVLRENGEEMPTDPVSDPISDSKVLPISAGRSSFGAGVQLKNAIGNWSRCLTDIFDIDDGLDDKDHLSDEEKPESQTKPFKAFRLLNALSDLMMVPFEMLADKSTRKEVCPMLSATLIKMVLYNFVPDEFCPTPIPEEVFEALDAVDDSEVSEESITNFPCDASPTVYSPPSASSLRGCIAGDSGSQTLHRSGSSMLRKSYTSDDELDELDSPIASIIKDNTREKPKGDRKVVRYQLLREAWKDSE